MIVDARVAVVKVSKQRELEGSRSQASFMQSVDSSGALTRQPPDEVLAYSLTVSPLLKGVGVGAAERARLELLGVGLGKGAQTRACHKLGHVN